MFKKLICGFVFFAFAFNVYSYQFDTIVTFGDSLSDNGNLYSYLAGYIPKSPPYYKGRFSNGPVWVENLYQSYFPNGKTANFQDFAVGGAGAVLSYYENLPYTLDTEVSDYLYLHNYTNKDKTLYIIWIGANNYLNGPTNVDDLTTSVVDAINNNIKSLIDHGSVMFLVVNSPDMGKTPAAAKANNQELLTELSNKHNEKLLFSINQLKEQYPNVNFSLFDVNSLFKQLMNNPQQFNLSNTSQPCYNGGFSLRSKQNDPVFLDTYLSAQAKQYNIVLDEKMKQAILANPVLKEAMEVSYRAQRNNASDSCNGSLFWDHVHPTTAVHQLIAQYAKSTLDEAGFQAITE